MSNELVKAQEEAIKDVNKKYDLKRRAVTVFESYKDITIARFESFGRGSTRGKMAIQPRSRAVFQSSSSNQPRGIGPGVYSIGKLFPQAGNTMDMSAEIGICCVVEDLPISAVFVFPDFEMLEHSIDELHDLRTCAIRTSDDLVGAVRVQMSLHCDQPLRLIKAFVIKHAAKHTEQSDQPIQNIKIERSKEKQGFWESIGEFFNGKQVEVQIVANVQPFTMKDLYPRINLELATVVRAAVRNYSAKDLYDTVDIRNRAELDIKEGMEVTLREYGIKIERVSALQFFSPEYEDMLAKRGELAIKEQQLQDVRKGAALQDQYRVIDQDQREKNITYGEEINRKKAVEGAKTKEVTDQFLSEDERRRRQREGEQNRFERDEDHLDHRADIAKTRDRLQLQNEWIEMQDAAAERQLKLAMQWTEHQQKVQGQQQALDHDQKLAAMKEIAKMPPEQALQYMMLYNPQLHEAFIAMQGAQGKDQQLEMALGFQQQLAAIYGQNSQQMNQLLVEAARLVAAGLKPDPSNQVPLVAIANTTSPKDPTPASD